MIGRPTHSRARRIGEFLERSLIGCHAFGLARETLAGFLRGRVLLLLIGWNARHSVGFLRSIGRAWKTDFDAYAGVGRPELDMAPATECT